MFVLLKIGYRLLMEIQGGMLPDVEGLLPPTPATVHAQYLAHIVLICLMIVATFIDFDEKTIPDAITVPGTVLALVLMTAIPTCQLPIVARLGGAWSPVHLIVTSSSTAPAWARRLQAEQRMRSRAATTTQAVKEGDRPSAGINPRLDDKDD